MMKTIVALLLVSSVSAFKPSKAFLGFGGLASASKYDPKIFEDASAAKDAFPIEQGERRLFDMEQCQNRCADIPIRFNLEEESPTVSTIFTYLCTAEPDFANSCHYANDGECDEPRFCDVGSDGRDCLLQNLPCPANSEELLREQLAAAEARAAAAEASLASCKESAANDCPDSCKTCWSGWAGDGGVNVVDGVCHDFCSVNGYCGATPNYQAGGTDCTTCAASSSGESRRSRTGSLSIIIPVVIAAVILIAAVLYLVRKRRVAAATPDETPQLDTEVQIEG